MKKLSQKELEWISAFEEINHRKPTPKEVQEAFANQQKQGSSQAKTASSDRKNKRHLALSLLIFVLLIVIAVLVFQLRQEKSQPVRTQQTSQRDSRVSKSRSSSKPSSSSSQSSSSGQSSHSSSGADHQNEKSQYWNSNKASQLADFMDSWGRRMKQPNYQKIAVELPVYWQDGSKLSSDETIVDAYEYWYGNGTSVHRYIFVISASGEPKVLYSQDTNGDRYVVKETENQELKAGFSDIVTGD